MTSDNNVASKTHVSYSYPKVKSKNKEELIFKIENGYSKLKKDLEHIPIELTNEKELEGHSR